MSSAYIELPVETDPEDALADAYASLQAAIVGWTPSQGQLDVWILQAVSAMAAAARDVASAVPLSIFRWFGAYLVGLPPVDDAPAFTTTTWTLVDNLGHTIPAGTQVAIPDAGGNLIPFETVEDIIVLPGHVTTDPGQVQIVAITPGTGGNTLGGVGTAIQLLDPLAFVSGLVTVAATAGGTDAESDADYINRLSAALVLLAPRPIVPNDFAILARTIDDAWRTVAIDGYNPYHNLLSANDASFETSVAGYTGTNATLAQSAAQAADGANSMRLTANSAADMLAVLAVGDAVTVAPGDLITAIASFRSAVTARNVKVGIRWLDGSNAAIGADVFSATVADSAAAWTQASLVGATAPALAAHALVIAYVAAPANAEQHYVDKVSLRRGNTGTTDWVAGGTAETGNARMITIASVKADGTIVGAQTKADQIAALQAKREVNFLVYAIDPRISQIAVTYTVHALANFDHTALTTSINAALSAYLSSQTWGTLPTDGRAWQQTTLVRYLEVAQTINNVLGVDYIVSLTIGLQGGTLAAADVTLPGIAPLASTGTLTGTIT